MAHKTPRGERQSGSTEAAGGEDEESELEIMPGKINWRDRIKVIAIGVSKYKYLQQLSGPKEDVLALQNLLTKNKETALVSARQFEALYDPTSAKIREAISKYSFERSASGDILIFYFSGHGVPIGNGDLGLCGRNTRIHMEYGTLPVDLVRFRDLVETLSTVHVHPVIIIDACFSGQAAASLVEPLPGDLKRVIQADKGSDYALLCSSTKLQESLGFSSGGIFSNLLNKVALRGLGDKNHRRNLEVSLRDLLPVIQLEAESSDSSTPLLLVGDTLPSFGFVRNSKYKPRTEGLTNAHKKALNAFWNEGKPQNLSLRELEKLGISAHSTYQKLRYSDPWALIENVDSKTRHLSERGVLFMQGKIEIPRKIQQDPVTGNWEASEGAESLKFEDI